MAFPVLEAKVREATGKGPARRLRAAKRVPGVLYGPGVETTWLSVDPKELQKVLSGESKLNTIIELRVDKNGGGTVAKNVVVRARQFHPLKMMPLHIDFYEIAMDREISLEVPVEFTGTAAGIQDGGIVQIVRRTVQVRCLPDKIPSKLTLDIAALKIGDSLHASDIKFPEGVRGAYERDFPVVACVPPEQEKVVAAVVEGVEGALAVPGAEGAAAVPGAPGAAAPGAAAAGGKPGAPGAPGAAPAAGAKGGAPGKGGEASPKGKK
ncbi:MAG TPA: 50S ribosomal protein L25 [Myxococcota bacterium]|jgi:large subunit ribosomal protein L25|nr:50S ribosomal protein L25 [Myxococcota bacterium]